MPRWVFSRDRQLTATVSTLASSSLATSCARVPTSTAWCAPSPRPRSAFGFARSPSICSNPTASRTSAWATVGRDESHRPAHPRDCASRAASFDQLFQPEFAAGSGVLHRPPQVRFPCPSTTSGCRPATSASAPTASSTGATPCSALARPQQPRARRSRPVRPGRPPPAHARARSRARGLRDVRRRGARERAPVRRARSGAARARAAARHAPRPARSSRWLLSTLDPTAVFEQIADVLKPLVDYDTIDISLVDEAGAGAGHDLRPGRYADEILAFRVPARPGSGRLGRPPRRAAAHQRHVRRPARGPHARHRVGAAGLHPRAAACSWTASSACSSSTVSAARTFDDHELETTQLFANLAAIAIRNARHFKEMEVQASTDGLTGPLQPSPLPGAAGRRGRARRAVRRATSACS